MIMINTVVAVVVTANDATQHSGVNRNFRRSTSTCSIPSYPSLLRCPIPSQKTSRYQLPVCQQTAAHHWAPAAVRNKEMRMRTMDSFGPLYGLNIAYANLTKISVHPLGFTRISLRNHVPKMLCIFLTGVRMLHLCLLYGYVTDTKPSD